MNDILLLGYNNMGRSQRPLDGLVNRYWVASGFANDSKKQYKFYKDY